MIKQPISNALWWAFLRGKRRYSNTAVRFPLALVQITCIYRGFGLISLAECVRAGVHVYARARTWLQNFHRHRTGDYKTMGRICGHRSKENAASQAETGKNARLILTNDV